VSITNESSLPDPLLSGYQIPEVVAACQALDELAAGMDLGERDRFFSLVQGFTRGRVREIRTELFGHLQSTKIPVQE
jgi:hypothetical protein